jgi:hypothetical protein
MSSGFGPVFGVIADARSRQWRQRVALIVLMLLVGGALALGVRGTGHGRPDVGRAGLGGGRGRASAPTATIASGGVCWFPTSARGRFLRTGKCVRATPATLLAPGIVRVASGVAPHRDPWVVSLQRLRAQTVYLLCEDERPIGTGQCLPYPHQPYAERAGNPPLTGTPPVVLFGGEGNCGARPVWNLIAGLVMRPGLAVYFRSPDGTRRIPLVSLDTRLQIPGGAFATLIKHGPVTLLARNRAGRTIYTMAVTNRGDKPTWCNGLDGGDWQHTSYADAVQNLQPRIDTYPFGLFVKASAPS